MQVRSYIVGAVSFFLGSYQFAQACDLCAIYTAEQMKGGMQQGISLTVSEQFTGFHRLQDDGQFVENEGNQSLNSSITQLIGRYDFSEKFGAQIAVPIISRNFKRAEDGEIKSGSESGVGDLSLLGLFTPYRFDSGDFFFRWGVRMGLKVPTGDTDRLKEETEEGHGNLDEASTEHEEALWSEEVEEHDHHAERNSNTAALMHAAHEHEEGIESGIHGHDLALGSGSWDYVIGSNVFIEKGKWFSDANIQYIIRSEGDFNYRYANDLLWELGAGRYLLLQEGKTFSIKANLSGEYKGMDVLQGNKAVDTGVNSMFLGPLFSYTQGAKLLVQLGLDLPLFVNNTDLQIVPDYRVRGSVTYRF